MSTKIQDSTASDRSDWWRLIEEQTAAAEAGNPRTHEWVELGDGLELLTLRSLATSSVRNTLD